MIKFLFYNCPMDLDANYLVLAQCPLEGIFEFELTNLKLRNVASSDLIELILLNRDRHAVLHIGSQFFLCIHCALSAQ